jgi:hypothetical protein
MWTPWSLSGMNNEHVSSNRILVALRAAPVFCAFALSLVSCRPESERLLEQTFERTIAVEPNVRFSLKNAEGSIRLYGAGTRDIKIQAIKKAYGRDRLEKISVNVTAKPGSVSIDTIYPPKPKLGLADRSGTVDYVIVLPENATVARLELSTGEVLIEGMRGSKVTASLLNGRMFDHNCFGEHQLLVANGGLDIIFDWWEGQKFSVDARIVNGNLRALIPSEAAFHLDAATEDGQVACDFRERDERPRDLVQKVDKTVGAGAQADIKLHATNGSIRVIEANP